MDKYVPVEVQSLARTGLILVLIWTLAAPPSMRGSELPISWVGGTGSYVDPSGWSCSAPGCNHTDPSYYPDNVEFSQNFTVTIDSALVVPGRVDNVTLSDVNPAIDTLSTGSLATLNVSGQILTVGTSADGTILTNAGTLNLSSGADLMLQNSTMGGASTISNSGSIILGANSSDSATLTFNGPGVKFDLGSGGTGSVTLSDNATNLIEGSTGTESLTNDAGHTIQGSGSISSLTSFTNNGILNANGSTPNGMVGFTSQGLMIDLGSGGTFTNNDGTTAGAVGTVNVTNGSNLTITSNSSTSITNNGNIYLGDGTTAGNLTLNDNGMGATFTFTGGGKLTLYSGNSLTGSVGDESLTNDTNHTIQGAGTIQNLVNFSNNGALNANAGGNLTIGLNSTQADPGGPTFTNGGTVNVTAGSTLTILSDNSTSITNSGNINLGNRSSDFGTLVLNDGGNGATTFTLTGTGTLRMSDNSNNLITGFNGDESLINDTNHTIKGVGLIAGAAACCTDSPAVTTSVSTSPFNGLASFTNYGTLEATSSRAGNALDVQASLTNWNSSTNTLAGGTYIVAGHGTLILESIGFGNSIQALDEGASVTIKGQGLLTGDGFTNALGGLTNISDGSTLNLEWVKANGGLTITPNGGTLKVDGTSSISVNNSDLTIAGGNIEFEKPDVTKSVFATAPGVENLMPAAGMTVAGNSTVTIDSDAELDLSGNNYTQTSGTTALYGTLAVGIMNLDGGTLTGGGEVDGSLMVDGGKVNPGGDPSPTALYVTGDYTQTALGIMDLDVVSSTSYDSLNVTGEAILNGTLEINLGIGFTAADGTYLDVINYGTESGDFSYFNDPVFNTGNGWQTFAEVFEGAGPNGLGLNSDALYLEVIATTEPVPEPSTFGMLFCAMLLGAGIGWKVRRRRAVIS